MEAQKPGLTLRKQMTWRNGMPMTFIMKAAIASRQLQAKADAKANRMGGTAIAMQA